MSTILHPQQFGGKPFDLNQMALPGMEDHAMLPHTARALANGYKFQAFDEDPHSSFVEAERNGARAGEISWNRSDGEIVGIGTMPRNRRQGVATAMMEIARTGAFGPPANHSDMRSDLGEVWATSAKVQGLGGNLPKRFA